MPAGGCLPMVLQIIWVCPCIALIKALLLCRLSCVVAYAMPKLDIASVREAADGLSSTAFMP